MHSKWIREKDNELIVNPQKKWGKSEFANKLVYSQKRQDREFIVIFAIRLWIQGIFAKI